MSPSESNPSKTPCEYLDALDRAARYYREALKHVVEECGNDRPRIDHIREAAERGLRTADFELGEAPVAERKSA